MGEAGGIAIGECARTSLLEPKAVEQSSAQSLQIIDEFGIGSRVHRSQEAGPDLIHVDAYRVEDDLDMETVDLEASLEDSVTVVEWGQGKADRLSEDRFELSLQFDGEDEDARKISLVALGEEPERRLAEWMQTRPLG